MKKWKMFTIAFLCMFMLSNCTARLMDFTVVSSKNVTLNVKKDAPRVIGKASSIKGATDKAIEAAGQGYDALIDGVIYSTAYYCVFFVLVRYKVEGTPIKSTEIKPINN